MDKVILVGGGTGGHCIPMVSLYKKFSKLNVSCLIITDKNNHVVGAMNMHDLLRSGVL
jgi:UDP-N-acetylglucosamine:LPS N-acetylglucosamine transferase